MPLPIHHESLVLSGLKVPVHPDEDSQSFDKAVIVAPEEEILVHGPAEEEVEYSHKYVNPPLPPTGRDELVIVVGSKLPQPF